MFLFVEKTCEKEHGKHKNENCWRDGIMSWWNEEWRSEENVWLGCEGRRQLNRKSKSVMRELIEILIYLVEIILAGWFLVALFMG